MTQPVEVVYFPKKCPHCRTVLATHKKFSGFWMECENDRCPVFVREDNTGGESRYTYNLSWP